ncbi:MAG: DUF1080 domain-containing protein [Opitutaceae bacterium]|nr:DUF1080 domain-containing protein [Opitutaceae bacterium]
MKHPFAMALALLCSLAASAAEPAWRDLFNGRDLTGWKIVGAEPKAKTWVEAGALTGHMVRGTPEHTFFCTEESFGDFILELECFQTGGFNTGILFRCVDTPPSATVRLHGYQVKIDPSPTRRWTGGLFDDYGKNWLWLQTLKDDDRARSAYRFNEWARFRIEAIGRTLKVWVNGIPTAHLLHDKYSRGPLAFKIHSFAANGDPAQEKNLIRYRRIRILTSDLARHAQPMDLPAREADPTQTVLPKP